MKQVYFFVLSIITTAFVIGLALLKVNEVAGGALFTIPTEYQKYVDYALQYGALTLLCCYAFGGLAGKVIKIVIGIVLLIAIALFTIAIVAPQWIQGMFGGAKGIITIFKMLN